MLDNKDNILYLRRLGLAADEAKLYIALLEKPMTHLELARKTGINRTKVYRLADELEVRGLIAHEQRDDGRFLAATDPSNLEILVVAQEENLRQQQKALSTVLPNLQTVFAGKSATPASFTINTYEGAAGLKQMLWNELKAKGEICIYAHDTLDQVAGVRWAEKYRALMAEKGVPHRVLENKDARHVLDHTKVSDYKNIYNVRFLDRNILDLQQELTIHDNVVSIYNWNRDGVGMKVGIEIHSKQFADFQRAMFETYWKLAK